MRISIMTATGDDDLINAEEKGDLEYHKAQLKRLQEEVVDPDDIEMLEDLIMAATNEAMRKIDEASQQSMSQITGALGGGLPF